MVTTGIFFGVTLLFALAGFWKGLLGSFLDLMAVLTAYLCLLFLARPLAGELQGRFPGMTAYVVAPIVILGGVWLVFAMLGMLLGRWRKGEDDVPRFRLAGAALNTITGVFYGSIAVWGVMLYQGLARGSEESSVGRPFVERFAGKLIGSVGSVAVRVTFPDEQLAVPAASKLLGDPASGMRSVQAIVQSPKFADLMLDPEFQEVLDGSTDAVIAQHPKLGAALADPTLERAFLDLGLTETAEQQAELRLKLASTMGLVHRRLKVLQSDPEFLKILDKPDFKQAVESKDVVALLRHPDTARLMELVVGGGT